MDSKKLILLNFSETRRRSIKLWNGIPDEYVTWKPDKDAFSVIEMVRHVLEGEHLFHKIIEKKGNIGRYESPWKGLEYLTIENELNIAQPFRSEFLKTVNGFSEEDLENIRIERSEVGQSKILGDYLNRMVYHEAVHAGQLLGYLRMLGVARPIIWD